MSNFSFPICKIIKQVVQSSAGGMFCCNKINIYLYFFCPLELHNRHISACQLVVVFWKFWWKQISCFLFFGQRTYFAGIWCRCYTALFWFILMPIASTVSHSLNRMFSFGVPVRPQLKALVLVWWCKTVINVCFLLVLLFSSFTISLLSASSLTPFLCLLSPRHQSSFVLSHFTLTFYSHVST